MMRTRYEITYTSSATRSAGDYATTEKNGAVREFLKIVGKVVNEHDPEVFLTRYRTAQDGSILSSLIAFKVCGENHATFEPAFWEG